MKQVIYWTGFFLLATVLSIQNGASAPLPAPRVAPLAPVPQPTLWGYLGIPQGYQRMKDGFSNRRGNRPNSERKPPVKRLADPENFLMPEGSPIKAAAEIKQQEDLKKQKIKAVKYLASIGCGCYNKEDKITNALLEALDDCTEDVRYETVVAIAEAACGEACENCKLKSCCSSKITKKLSQIAYEHGENGCFLEPSERVREAAIEALGCCCPGQGPAESEGMSVEPPPEPIEPPPKPIEPPPGTMKSPLEDNGAPGTLQPTPANSPSANVQAPARSAQFGAVVPAANPSENATQAPAPVVKANANVDFQGAKIPVVPADVEIWTPLLPQNSFHVSPMSYMAIVPETEPVSPELVMARWGVVTRVLQDKHVEIELPDRGQLKAGTRVKATHPYLLRAEVVGDFVITSSSPGRAVGKATGRTWVAVGDKIHVQTP